MKRFLDWQINFYHARGDEATAKAIQREILGEDGIVEYFRKRLTIAEISYEERKRAMRGVDTPRVCG